MFAYSASQAVSPAINRTRTYLFRPFRFSTYLKLAAVATITEGFGGSIGFNQHHAQGHAFAAAATLSGGLFSWDSAAGVAAIAALVLAFIALAVYIFYLVTRLRFAFFHCLVHQTREILPGWRRYAVESMRMFTFSLP